MGLLLAVGLLAVAPGVAEAAPATLTVNPAGDNVGDCIAAPCATIAYAVGQAQAGDTIEVGAGTYSEALNLTKAVTLRGPNAGVDAGAARAPEAVISSAAIATITARVAGIAIDGFTVEGSGTYSILGAAKTDGLRIVNDIVRNRGRFPLQLNGGGAGEAVEGNRLEALGSVSVTAINIGSAGTFTDLAIADNAILSSPEGNGIFSEGSVLKGFRFTGNLVNGSNNIGSRVEAGLISGNTFDVGSGELGLQVDLHESTVSGNVFHGNGEAPCLQIFGSQYGLDPSAGATISGNAFDGCNRFGIQLSPDIEDIAIVGNAITGSHDGINTRAPGEGQGPWTVDPSVQVRGNRIVGSTHLGIDNTVAGTIDAADNWWGCNAGPAAAAGNGCDPIFGGVQASPWLLLSAAAPSPVTTDGDGVPVSAAIDTDSAGGGGVAAPDGTPVSFLTDFGSLDAPSGALAAGQVADLLRSDRPGEATVSVTVDNQTVTVPVRIDAPPSATPPTASTPPVSSPPKPVPAPAPQVSVEGDGSPLQVSATGAVQIASVTCPSGGCVIAIAKRKVMVGGRGFPIDLKLTRSLVAGQQTTVTAVLPASARRALAEHGRGKSVVLLRVFSGAGVETIPVHVTLKFASR